MDEKRAYLEHLGDYITMLGIKIGVASLLETAGSLTVLFAQVFYLSQSLLSGALSRRSLHAFAQVIENPIDRRELYPS